MRPVVPCGRYSFSFFQITLLPYHLKFMTLISCYAFYSLVMEYADNGDVFQKICNYQKRETYIKEKKIWYVFI